MVELEYFDVNKYGVNEKHPVLSNIINSKGSVNLGTDNTLSDNANMICLGSDNTCSKGGAIAIGRYSESSGTSSIALGYNAESTGEGSIAINNTISSGKFALSCGTDVKLDGVSTPTEATGTASVAIGGGVKATGGYSFAEGVGCVASGNQSIAMGFRNNSSHQYQMSVGKFNNDTNSLFVVGNGTSNSARSNALEVNADGTVSVQTSLKIGNTVITESQLQALLALL